MTADSVLVNEDDLVQVWAITIRVRISTDSSKVGYNERVLLHLLPLQKNDKKKLFGTDNLTMICLHTIITIVAFDYKNLYN